MEEEEKNEKEPICSFCGLRSYQDFCPSCGTLIVKKNDKEEEEEEESDWRERKK